MTFLRLPVLLISLVVATAWGRADYATVPVDGTGAGASPPQFGNSAMNRYLSLMLPAGSPGSLPLQLPGLVAPGLAPIGGSVSYQKYTGDGSLAAGWPAKTAWIDLASMWKWNLEKLTSKICDNSDDENDELLKAIKEVAESTEVDPRFILAIVMEESRGCVRVGATSLAVVNPGLMQSYEGKGSCATPLQNPCPYSEIKQMIVDGTAPNPAGEDLQDLLARPGPDDDSRYYRAARMYNSGQNSIGLGGELSVGGANACYASDIANRLLGYTGDGCGGTGS